ncbi:MAG: xanthine dehydrogenase family protein molybdopterin-binding subunit [Thaumarchaeota archaeon]|nr:xanthine dehydrogenase family protein molybdopterin-binding subunit [Nitrososphaerota archaeon]
MIGREVPRIEGFSKVTGRLTYVSDVEVPGMLHAKVLRSPFPHAKIKSIYTSKAERLQGVWAVLTGKETPGIPFGYMDSMADKLPLCRDVVRFVGDEVAAVAADDPETALDALELIDVEYEELAAVFDPEEALKPTAPKIHAKGNVAFFKRLEVGNVDKAFSEADLIHEGTYSTHRQAHVAFETRGCVAEWDAQGNLTVTSATQTPHIMKTEIAKSIGIPSSKVRVKYPPMGGAFGNRLVMSMLEPIAAMLAKKANRPVRLVNTREEEFLSARPRYPLTLKLKSAFRKDGRLMGCHAQIIGDNGAYNDKGPGIVGHGYRILGVLYNVPNIIYETSLVYTNNQPGTAFRGFGMPQSSFAIESHMDEAAEILGLDPIQIRLRNVSKPNMVTNAGAHIFSNGVAECVSKATVESGWGEKHGKKRQENGLLKGIGLALTLNTGGGNRKYGYNSADAFIKINDDGVITLITSAVDLGTGADTVMAQIVATVLGVAIEDVRIVGRDTEITPYDLGALADRTTFVHGNAVKAAAEDARRELLEAASHMLGKPVYEFDLGGGYVSVKNEDKRVRIAEVALHSITRLGKAISGKGRYHDELAPKVAFGEEGGFEFKGGGLDCPTWSFACHIAEVSIDPSTGRVKVENYAAAVDCGTVINPIGARGNVFGGISQGVGLTLMERLVIADGALVNPNLGDYKIPSFRDVPAIKTGFVETHDPLGPFGAKGLGDGVPSGVPGAIANAIYDAASVRIRDLPVTPEKLLAEMRRNKA